MVIAVAAAAVAVPISDRSTKQDQQHKQYLRLRYTDRIGLNMMM